MYKRQVQGITDLINVPGLINLDFADVQTVMTDKGIAHIGIGKAKGDDKAIEAVKQAVSSPLLETSIEGASHVIINISGDISLIEANEAASYVQELVGDDANIIFGAMYDENAQDEATITVIATGLNDDAGSVSQTMNNFNTFNLKNGAVEAAAAAQPQQSAPQTAAPRFATARPMGTTTARPAASGVSYGSQAPAQSAQTQIPTPTPVIQPRPTVKPADINIPDFLRNKR